MILADRIVGGVLLLGGIAIGAAATTYRVGFMTDPVGPRALPYLTAFMIAAAGLALLARPRSDRLQLHAESGTRTVGAGVAFAAYALVLPVLGFFTATAAVVLALARLFGGPWRAALVSALVTAGTLWLLFVALLQLPLPVGSLWIL